MSLCLPSDWKHELKTANSLNQLVSLCVNAEKDSSSIEELKKKVPAIETLMENVKLLYERVCREWGPLNSPPHYSLKEYQLSIREGLRVRERLPKNLSKQDVGQIHSILDRIDINPFDSADFCSRVTQLPWLMATEANKLSASCAKIERLTKRLSMKPQEFHSVFGSSKLSDRDYKCLARISYDLFQLRIHDETGLQEYLTEDDCINLSRHPNMHLVAMVLRVLTLYHGLSSYQQEKSKWERFDAFSCEDGVKAILHGKELVDCVEGLAWEQLAPILQHLPFWCPSFDFDTLLHRAVQLSEVYKKFVDRETLCSQNTVDVIRRLHQQRLLENRVTCELLPRIVYFLEHSPARKYTFDNFTLPIGFEYDRPRYPVLCEQLQLQDSRAVMGAFIQFCADKGHRLSLRADTFSEWIEEGCILAFPPKDFEEIPLDGKTSPHRPSPDLIQQSSRIVPSKSEMKESRKNYFATLLTLATTQ